MAPILYKSNPSPPCRAVLLVAKALELELEFKDINIAAKEHLEAEFVELNPQHSIPVLDDDGFILCESHAICTYLAGKYGSDDSLYPSDLQQRSLIDHKLFFDCGKLQALLHTIVAPILFEGERSIPEHVIDKVNGAYGLMETFLQDREWLVGDSVTVADLSTIASISTLNILVPIDSDIYTKLTEWISRIEELPYYDANSEGLDEFKATFDHFMSS